MTRRLLLRAVYAVCALLLLASRLDAAEIHVISSGGFLATLKEVAPIYEKRTGNTVIFEFGPSMGDTRDAIPQRLARGERIDAVVMVGSALDKLVQQGKVASEDRVVLARSGVGAAVRAGAPVPDISTVDKLRDALLAAPSIAYSDSASGVYIQNEMFKKLGIEDQVRGKARMIPATPVGEIVAKGEAALGFQQISELKPVPGITIAGPLPPPVQLYTLYSAGVLADSPVKQQARELLQFLASPEVAPAIDRSGMEPIPRT